MSGGNARTSGQITSNLLLYNLHLPHAHACSGHHGRHDLYGHSDLGGHCDYGGHGCRGGYGGHDHRQDRQD